MKRSYAISGMAVLAVMFAISICDWADAQVQTGGTLSNSTITAVLDGFNPAVGNIPTGSYLPPSGCPLPAPGSSQGEINKIKCGLYASDSLTNETETQQQLQSSPGYWYYGGDAPAENATYSFYRDSQGLHIGVQAPSNGTYAGYYAVAPSSDAMLFHAVVTAPVRTVPYGDFQNGLYVQTTQAPVNYVTCVAITNNQATVWAVVHTYGSPYGSLVFQTLWYDPSANQPLTRDCTIITNGNNYLKVYLDGSMVYSSDALALGMPAPFYAFLEPQTSYNGQELFGSYQNFYTTDAENIKIQDNPPNAANAEVVNATGYILASSPVLLGNASINLGQFDFPFNATVKVVDSNNVQLASTPSPVAIYGGDVYSVVSGTSSSGGSSSGGTTTTGTATTYSGRATGLAATTQALNATFADTGPLPPQGGEIDASGTSVQSPTAQGEALLSSTMGLNNTSQSEATTSDIVLLPGTANQITADFVRAESSATCSAASGSSDISNLKIAGQQVNVTGAINQTVTVPGVLTLVINEQAKSSGGTSNQIAVNALDLRMATGDRVVVSSASSGIACDPVVQNVSADFMTGGGYIMANNARETFGFVAGYKPHQDTLSGELDYIDHGGGMHVKSTSVTSYGGTGNTRTFGGQATINGVSGYTFTVTATDNGNPGKNNDNFGISLSNGYSASGILAGGNIKLHA